MNKETTYKIKNFKAMQHFAATLAGVMAPAVPVLLHGTLGVGKTTLVREVLTSLTKVKMEVLSPTFMLLQTYPTPKGELWHYDLYRLKASSEAIELGLHDALENHLTCIEWPEIIKSLLPDKVINLHIDFDSTSNNEESRVVRVTAPSEILDFISRNMGVAA